MAEAGVADADEDGDAQDHQREQRRGRPETCGDVNVFKVFWQRNIHRCFGSASTCRITAW